MDNEFTKTTRAAEFHTNHHGHTSIDHFLAGLEHSNRDRVARSIQHHQRNICRCLVCEGWGITIEEINCFSPSQQPIYSAMRYAPCPVCLGTGLDKHKVRRAEAMEISKRHMEVVK